MNSQCWCPAERFHSFIRVIRSGGFFLSFPSFLYFIKIFLNSGCTARKKKMPKTLVSPNTGFYSKPVQKEKWYKGTPSGSRRYCRDFTFFSSIRSSPFPLPLPPCSPGFWEKICCYSNHGIEPRLILVE